MPQFIIVLTYDDGCNGAAQMLYDNIVNDPVMTSSGFEISVKTMEIAIAPSTTASTVGAPVASHREFLFRTFQDLYNVPHENLYVISLLRTANHEEYMKVNELCTKSTPPIACQVVSHVGGFNDVGLLVRNLVRRVSAFVVPSPPQGP